MGGCINTKSSENLWSFISLRMMVQNVVERGMVSQYTDEVHSERVHTR
jgi:hypothetical protein